MLNFLKDENGYFSATAVFAAASVGVVLLRVLIGGVSVVIADHTYQVAAMDATLATGVLATTLGAYVAQRHTKAKYKGNTLMAKTETTITTEKKS